MKIIKQINEWEVLTPSGWSNFSGVSKLAKDCYVNIKFTDGTYIKCSENHKIKSTSGEFVYAKDIKKGMAFIGKLHTLTVKSRRKINSSIFLYDLNNVDKNKEFFANDILSSNCALIDTATELWSSAAPALSTGGKCILLSTPRGVGSFFHKMWQDAEDSVDGKVGKNDFHAIKLPWDLHPERNDEWRRIEGHKQPSPKEAAREFDCDFSTSGDNVVDLAIIDFYKKNIKRDPVECGYHDKSLWKWVYPDYSHTYIVSADTSRGDGGDFQACHVIDPVTMEQCAEYKGQISTKDYGNLLVNLATEYNDALLVIERENTGWAVIQAVLDRGYKNLFYTTKDLKYVDPEHQMSNRYNAEEKRAVAGFSTNTNTRPLVISSLESYFRENTIKIYSTRTLSELETFIWKNGKAQAMEGYNDDLTMSLGIGLWIRDTALRLRQEGIDLTKTSLNSFKQSELDTTPVFQTNQIKRGQEQWQLRVGTNKNGMGEIESLKWLIG